MRSLERCNWVLLILLTLSGWSGCNRDRSRDESFNKQDGAVETASKESDDPPDSQADDPAVSGDDDADSSNPASTSREVTDSATEESGEIVGQSDGSTDDRSTDPLDQAVADLPVIDASERILLLAPAGPLIIDVQFVGDSQSGQAESESALEKAALLADLDRDGRPTWQELSESMLFRSGRLGNEPINEENAESLIGRYDVNRNNQVDATELRRFLSRGMGGSGEVVYSSANYYRNTNRTDSMLFGSLDTNHDGWLSVDECHQALTILAVHDQDGNESLSLAELTTPGSDLPDPFTGQRSFGTDTAVALHRRPQWDEVFFILDGLYRKGSALTEADFPLTPRLFLSLDQNEDGELSWKELAASQHIAAHLTLRINFADQVESSDTDSATRPLQVVPSPTLQQMECDSLDRSGIVDIALGSDRLTVFAVDRRTGIDTEAQANQLLSALDANGNGYLEADESAGALGLDDVGVLDNNEDGNIQREELRYYFEIIAAINTGQRRIQIGDQIDALFAYADRNGDGQLAGRELDDIGNRLSALDKNGDGQVDWDEIPHAMLIAIGRGPMLTVNDQRNIARARPQRKGPEWFTNMDVNRDGEISLSEFLGDETLFRRLDTDQDGYVEADEVAPD